MRLLFAWCTVGILVACGGSEGGGDGGATATGAGTGASGGESTTSATGGGGSGPGTGTGGGGMGGAPPTGSYTMVGVGNWGLRGITTDATSFTICRNPTQGSDHTPDLLRAVSYGAGVFVAVGGDANSMVMRSLDGVHWEEDLHPVTACDGESYPASCNNWMGGVAYGDGTWLAGGGNGALMRSVDGGTSWSGLHPSPRLNPVRSIAFGNGVFAAGTDGGVVSVSTDDGDSWTHHDLWEHSFGVAYGGGVFIAQGRHYNGSGFDYGCAVSTDDGASWASCDPALVTARTATYADGRWLAAVDGGFLQSDDGTSWSFQAAPDFPERVMWTGTLWLGLGGGRAWTSSDLVSWQQAAMDVPGFRSITGGLVLDDNLPVQGVDLCQDNG